MTPASIWCWSRASASSNFPKSPSPFYASYRYRHLIKVALEVDVSIFGVAVLVLGKRLPWKRLEGLKLESWCAEQPGGSRSSMLGNEHSKLKRQASDSADLDLGEATDIKRSRFEKVILYIEYSGLVSKLCFLCGGAR